MDAEGGFLALNIHARIQKPNSC